jgi:hypothetical protein
MSPDTDGALDGRERLSLCETLDRVLNKGVVLAGEVLVSVADVDLIYLGLQVLLTSVETARQYRQAALYAGVGIGAAGEARA